MQTSNEKAELKKDVAKAREDSQVKRANVASDNKRTIEKAKKVTSVEETLEGLNEIIKDWPSPILNVIEDEVLPLPMDALSNGVDRALGSLLFRTKAALAVLRKESEKEAGLVCAKQMKEAHAERKKNLDGPVTELNGRIKELLAAHQARMEAERKASKEALQAILKPLEEAHVHQLDKLLAEQAEAREKAGLCVASVEDAYSRMMSTTHETWKQQDDKVNTLIGVYVKEK